MLGNSARWLAAFVLILLGSGAIAQETQPAESPVSHWENLIPTLQPALPKPCPNPDWELKILDAAFIPPGGPSFAVVDYCETVPSADWIAVMQLESDKPVLARFRDGRKRTVNPDFLQAASVTEFADVRIAPDRTTILDFRQENDAKGLPIKCQVAAYVWNPATKTFDYNAPRSKAATHGECGE